MLELPPILVAEDEEGDVLLLRRALRKAGILNPLVHVVHALDAIRYLHGDAPYGDRAQHPLPALILVDLNLPGGHGFELLTWRQAHPEFQRLPAVVLTSSEHPEDQRKARQLGAADYLVKPTKPDALVTIVQNLHARWLAS